MAENYSPFNKQPHSFTRGLNTDVNEEFQPDGTYRFALNAVLTTDKGEKGAVSTEEGNKMCCDLEDSSAHVIGNCLLDNGNVILFISYEAYGAYPAHGAIAVQREDCTLEYLIRSECLDFRDVDIINCEYKIQSGCDTIIYFTDRRSRYKRINLSKLERYVQQGINLADANTPSSGVFGWDCSQFNFDPDYNVPNIQLMQIEFGGSLRVGAYAVAVRYLDDSLNGTNWTPSSNPIYITASNIEDNSMSISGGILNPNNLVDGSYYASKSINIQVNNLDRRYQYLQIAVFEFSQGTASNNATFVSTPYGITDDFIDIRISDLSPTSGFVAETSTNITVPQEYIDIVRAHAQVERRLLVANLQNEVTDWSKFQLAANNIKALYYTYDRIANEDTFGCYNEIINQFETGGVKGSEFNRSEFLFDHKTYMRDEVYAFAIVYVFKNGKESPAFHIPGRPAIANVGGTSSDGKYSVTGIVTPFASFNNGIATQRWYGDYNDTWGTGTSNFRMYDNYNSPAGGSWDREIYSYEEDRLKPYIDYSTYVGISTIPDATPNSATMANTMIDKSQNILDSSICSSVTQVERWEFVNTSIRFNDNINPNDLDDPTALSEFQALTADTVHSAGLCAYYETDSRYPDIRDCDGNYIFPHTRVSDTEVIMHRIRHHKMPDSRKEPIFEGQGEDATNVLVRLRPLGMFFYDVSLPVGYENDIQGFYIVRSDRSGNKTIIDKGWLNVCDTSVGLTFDSLFGGFSTGQLTYKNENTIQQNPIWMVPTDKFGSFEPNLGATIGGEYAKRMHITGSNYVEFFSPKSSFNEPVNLMGSYYKLENTIITSTMTAQRGLSVATYTDNDNNSWSSSISCDEANGWEGWESWRVYGMIECVNMKLPRMFSYNTQGNFYLLHNVPIIYSEYTLYNQDNISTNSFTLNNENHRQTMMISKLYNEYYGLIGSDPEQFNHATMFKPLALFTGNYGSGPTGSPDIINPGLAVGNGMIDVEYLAKRYRSDINGFGETERGHIYYAALKSRIKPYGKLEDITYIKATNQIQSFPEVGLGASFETWGDCFIAKQKLFKSFQKGTKTNAENNGDGNGKLAGTILIGYVESEINAHFRHKQNDDTYYALPFDTLIDSTQTAVKEVHESDTSLVDFIEHLYRYNLDFSVDNRNRMYFPLPDVFDYCSQCSERFPVTIRYSEPSLSTQTIDNYKIFLANSIQEIPVDTGEITNMFVKEQNLFVHTVSNLYRLNLAPQELETGNDRIQVGSGTLANAVPQRLFDNTNGYGRGGTEFEHSGAFCTDTYIWVDNKSKRVYGLSRGVEELSMLGINRWFRKNLELTLREQWKSITGSDYPFLNTSGNRSIGFIGAFDPMYDRYILTKKDYELTGALLQNLHPDEGGDYIIGEYYWNANGLCIAKTEDSLEEVNLEQEFLVKNKSFTISYSLEDKCWVSFHSYRPNHIWNDNNTFYTSINNPSFSDYTWQHNNRNFGNYYTIKNDFILDYVSKGQESIISKSFESIEILGNVYLYNSVSEQWREVFYNTFDRLHVYNNTQSSGMFNVVIKNELEYYDIYNNHVATRTISVHRDRDVWKINNLRDYTSDASMSSTETINTNNWALTDYSDYFTDNQNIGYIDYAANPNYINQSKDVYQLQRFKDKFLNVRLFYKPEEDYKMVINLTTNLKRTLI